MGPWFQLFNAGGTKVLRLSHESDKNELVATDYDVVEQMTT